MSKYFQYHAWLYLTTAVLALRPPSMTGCALKSTLGKPATTPENARIRDGQYPHKQPATVETCVRALCVTREQAIHNSAAPAFLL